MSVLTQPIPPRLSRTLRVGLLAVLAFAAVWLWSAPWRQERRLRSASLAQLQRLARSEPDNARLFYYLGTRARQAGQPDAAYDAFTHAADLNADDEASWLGAADLAGRMHGSQGEYDLLSLYLSRHPRSAPAHAALARFYHRRRVYLSAYREALASATLTPRDAGAWRMAGSEAMLGQSYPEAEAALRQAAVLRPRDWANQVGWGDALMALHRSPEALACYRQAIRLAPEEPIPAVSLARALLTHSASAADIREAQTLLLGTARRSPQVALTYLLLGQSYERQSRWREARAALEEAGRRDTRLNEVHFELGRVAQNTGDAQAAVREQAQYQRRLTDDAKIYSLRLHIAQARDDVGARLTLARLCAQHGDRAEAVFQCRQVLARHPDSEPARAALDALTLPNDAASLTARAEALQVQGRWSAAERLYARALGVDPAAAPAAQGLGLCLMKEGQPARAFPYLAYAARLDPRLPEAQAALAALYRDAGFADEARKRLTLAVRSAPGRADFWHALGQIEGGADAYASDAEKALARAVALAPGNNAYRLDLAEQEAANSRGDKAEADYRRAAADAPQDADALSRLGGFLLDSSPTSARRREAEDLLHRALARDPANIYARYKLGKLALEQGDTEGAVSALTTVTTRSPDIAEAWYSLGMALERRGDSARADRALAASRRLQQTFQERISVQEQITLHPRDPALRLKMARLYAKNGENARALYEYQASLHLAPANQAVRAKSAALEARLRGLGCLPSMSLYAALTAQMTQTHS